MYPFHSTAISHYFSPLLKTHLNPPHNRLYYRMVQALVTEASFFFFGSIPVSGSVTVLTPFTVRGSSKINPLPTLTPLPFLPLPPRLTGLDCIVYTCILPVRQARLLGRTIEHPVNSNFSLANWLGCCFGHAFTNVELIGFRCVWFGNRQHAKLTKARKMQFVSIWN